jgi:exodeoxyribonuclease VII large subunit
VTNFFEFREKLLQPKDEAPSRELTKSREQRALTVSELTRQIDRVLQANLPQTVVVRGEVSNFSAHGGSGHLYFTLKDADACLDCVMWRSDAQRLKFVPTDGMELIATGHVAVYAQRGRHQLYVRTLSPLGQGALELAFQQLRKKLAADGLFAAERKKPLPSYPRAIAIVTAAQAAALHDMLKVLRRYPWLRLYLYAVPVQGEAAAPAIAAALNHLSRQHREVEGIDVILLARGGGSLEDLWAFNEEAVARAMAACAIPIVTGIGHEVDVSIADLIADHHAHTPTEAAAVVTAHWRGAADLIESTTIRLRRGLRMMSQSASQRLGHITRHPFFRRPTDGINSLRQMIDDRQRSLRVAMNARLWELKRDLGELEGSLSEQSPTARVRLLRQRLTHAGERLIYAGRVAAVRRASRLDGLERELRAVSPDSVLKRGFSITKLKKSGDVVRNVAQIKGGEELVTRVSDGEFESTAEDPKQPKLFGG